MMTGDVVRIVGPAPETDNSRSSRSKALITTIVTAIIINIIIIAIIIITRLTITIIITVMITVMITVIITIITIITVITTVIGETDNSRSKALCTSAVCYMWMIDAFMRVSAK